MFEDCSFNIPRGPSRTLLHLFLFIYLVLLILFPLSALLFYRYFSQMAKMKTQIKQYKRKKNPMQQ